MNYKEKEKININFSSNKNLLSISINSYKEKYNERKSDIFFIIKITNNYSNKAWEIEKTITDFQNLYEKLFSLHPNLPLIPKKTIFKITSLHIMDKRKYELQNFLRFCIQRKDILLNNDFINFLEISQNFPELVGNVVEKKEEINLFEFSVLDFIYIKNKNLLIVLCINNDYISSDDMNIDNILTLRNSFIGEKSPLSHILIFEYKKEENKIIINKLWKKSFYIYSKIIIFEEQNEILCIGNDDGKIYLYKTKEAGSFVQMENFAELNFHSEKIVGLYLNPKEQKLYSCSSDCMFFVIDLKDKSFNKSLIYNNMSGYTGLKYIKKFNIFITSDEDGIISIFTFDNFHYILFINIQTKSLSKINSFYLNENILFTGGDSGHICFIDISEYQAKKIKEIYSFNIGENKIKCLIYNSIKDEIIIGNEKGHIIIWNNNIKNFIYLWRAHTPYGVNSLLLDQNNILWSCGNDKKIIKWKMPDKWYNDKILFSNNYYEVKKYKKKSFDIRENEDFSSDEDELNGWSNK